LSQENLRIALTPGDPAGIGPDLCIALADQVQAIELVVICDPQLLEERAVQLDHSFEYRLYDVNRPATGLSILPVKLAASVHAGKPDPANAAYVLSCIDTAIEGCQDSQFAAMVTGPVSKAVICDSGINFSGHTGYLADKTGTGRVVMMLAAGELRVALVTTHIPLAEVSRSITTEKLQQTLNILDKALREGFGIEHPRLLVCGLNPHAGEGGHLGTEDRDIIEPALYAMRDQGLDITGPVPADTAFNPATLANADAVLAMYHDQGLPVLKHAGFGRAVNITLGLPIIRTSVDHGTAFDLAGTGRADSGSLAAALETAISMAHRYARNR
jgi:4-hydroxythreonine-4-phosphate dehydrogenase